MQVGQAEQAADQPPSVLLVAAALAGMRVTAALVGMP
jgi:hypothetical protein